MTGRRCAVRTQILTADTDRRGHVGRVPFPDYRRAAEKNDLDDLIAQIAPSSPFRDEIEATPEAQFRQF